ncbi:MAG: hypothetical protein RLZZ358_2059 [Bacteroidota bacterium]|jgi:hypothetical protein
MKKISFFITLICMSFISYGQDQKVPHQSVFAELGGSGLAFSFNYDFRFDASRMDSWGMRVGAGGFKIDGDSFYSFPVVVNRLYGKGPHYFEVGAGLTLFGQDDETYAYCSNSFLDSNGVNVCIDTVVSDSGQSFILPVDGPPSLMGTMNFGYRKVPVDGGLTWRVNLTPIFNNNGFWPLFAGVGIGYAF